MAVIIVEAPPDTGQVVNEEGLPTTFQLISGRGPKGESGDAGDDGSSAYQVAVANGFMGDEAAWLSSLIGIGDPGPDGSSAYEIAVLNGFSGTESEWIASLKGDDGAGVVASVEAPIILTDGVLSLDESGFDPAGAADSVASDVVAIDGRVTALEDIDPVLSVNGQTGTVVLDASDVGALDQASADGFYDALGAASAAQVAAADYTDSSVADEVTARDSAISDEASARSSAITNAIDALINGAPGTLDTLNEIADQLATDESAVSALTTTVAGKVAKADFDANTILKADTDDTPSALTVGASTLVGRGSAGSIAALTASQVRTLLSLVIGTDIYSKDSVDSGFQPLDSELGALAGLTSAADKAPYFTGSGTAALATLTTYGRSIIDDADAATTRTTIGHITNFVGKRSGVLTVLAGTARLYNDTGRDLTIIAVRITAETSPTGAAILVDVNKSGTTIFTSQSNRPSIAASGTTAKAAGINVSAWPDGDYLTFDVDQIGSTIAGSDLTVQVTAR